MKEPDSQFWHKVREAKHPLLALDYDGTLAPFHVERMDAVPLPGMMETLEHIIEKTATTLAVISGRPLLELDTLMGEVLQRAITIGSHGWEWRDQSGRLRPAGPDPATGSILEEAREFAVEQGKRQLGDKALHRVERKTASVAVHVRGLGEEEARKWMDAVRTRWQEIKSTSLEVTRFDGGLEIRSMERNKGQALKELMDFTAGADLVVYVGDDATDEDAFQALPENGAGVKVGPGATAARYRLPDCQAAKSFLDEWLKQRTRR